MSSRLSFVTSPPSNKPTPDSQSLSKDSILLSTWWHSCPVSLENSSFPNLELWSHSRRLFRASHSECDIREQLCPDHKWQPRSLSLATIYDKQAEKGILQDSDDNYCVVFVFSTRYCEVRLGMRYGNAGNGSGAHLVTGL